MVTNNSFKTRQTSNRFIAVVRNNSLFILFGIDSTLAATADFHILDLTTYSWVNTYYANGSVPVTSATNSTNGNSNNNNNNNNNSNNNSNSNSKADSDTDKGGLSSGAIAGIVVGIVAAVSFYKNLNVDMYRLNLCLTGRYRHRLLVIQKTPK